MNTYSVYLARYLHKKRSEHWEDRKIGDFLWFSYEDKDTIGECLSRKMFHILNLVLLSVLGFAGAYVGILRYDVR